MKFTVDRIDHVVMTCRDIAVTAAWLFSVYHKKKRKRKRKHHGHDRINPTRAEIGGLPPPRSKERRNAPEAGKGDSPFDP